ncbi:MAG: DUF892 family protein [Bacteroidota bacterium]
MKTIIDLNDLMIDQLNEMYNGNKLLLESIARIKSNVSDLSLLNMVQDDINSIEEQILHIKRAFDMVYMKQHKKKAYVFVALVERLNHLIKVSSDAEIKDAAIVIALQHINHYKIASFGAICTYAKMLDLYPIASLIHQSLEQEKMMDKRLAIRAEEVINRKAQIGDL